MNDLKKVTEMAYKQVSEYGFSEKVGHLSFHDEGNFSESAKPYHSNLRCMIDEEVRQLVGKAYEHSVELITEHREHVAQVAKLLLERETLHHDDLIQVLGKRPF